MNEKNILSIINIEKSKKVTMPLFLDSVSAGFPSPATDYLENKLDLNEHLVKHPAATFIVKASGPSMVEAGISSGDLLIVDRSVTPKNDNIVKKFFIESFKIIFSLILSKKFLGLSFQVFVIFYLID